MVFGWLISHSSYPLPSTSGRYGSGAWVNMRAGAADAFGEILTDIYGRDNQSDSERQLQAQKALQNAYQYF